MRKGEERKGEDRKRKERRGEVRLGWNVSNFYNPLFSLSSKTPLSLSSNSLSPLSPTFPKKQEESIAEAVEIRLTTH